MNFLDTNILLYTISTAADEARKRDIAVNILKARDNALSVQVLQEFYVQATRPTRTDALPHDIAVAFISTWLRYPVQDLTLPVMSDALDIKSDFKLSYWDAAIVAAARALGCRTLLSEDLAHGSDIGGVKIVNPFR
jgi:predicted nucleic acid-binding protein